MNEHKGQMSQLDFDNVAEEDKVILNFCIPEFLRHDLEMLNQGRRKNLDNILDLLYNEVQGSINGAYYSDIIDKNQADYLRRKYLMQEDI